MYKKLSNIIYKYGTCIKYISTFGIWTCSQYFIKHIVVTIYFYLVTLSYKPRWSCAQHLDWCIFEVLDFNCDKLLAVLDYIRKRMGRNNIRGYSCWLFCVWICWWYHIKLIHGSSNKSYVESKHAYNMELWMQMKPWVTY
jgi:hypothetical protein